MAKKIKKAREHIEVNRFARCPVAGCDVREWHRHTVMADFTGGGVSHADYGEPELLEEALPPPTEPEAEPAPAED